MIGIARELRPRLTDAYIINQLSRHFSEEIQNTILTRGIQSLNELLNLLEKIDQAGPINLQRKRFERTYRPQNTGNRDDQNQNITKTNTNAQATGQKYENSGKNRDTTLRFRAITMEEEDEKVEIEQTENKEATSPEDSQ